MDFSFLDKYRALAVSQYHVDPAIFIALMAITTPFWYHSWFLILKELKEIYKDKKENKAANLILDNKKLLNAICYNFIVWLVPYAYVLFFGRGLPLKFWLFFSVGLLVTLGLQVKRMVGAFRKR